MERSVGRPPLIVYYRGYLYRAAAVWPICWWMLYGVFIRSEGPFIRHGQGALIGRLFTVFVVAVNGAAGPVLTAYFSLRLEITDAEIDVRKYFGLWRRRYPLRGLGRHQGAPRGRLPGSRGSGPRAGARRAKPNG
jgi:hypothetical protein